jgi:hypothetical protein
MDIFLAILVPVLIFSVLAYAVLEDHFRKK